MGTQYCVCRGFQFPTYNPNTEGSLWPLFFPTVNTEGYEIEETRVEEWAHRAGWTLALKPPGAVLLSSAED